MDTEVMMLGGLGSARAARSFGPRLTTNFLPPPKTTPQEPQNLMRQTVMNGLGAIPWYASWIPQPPLPPTPSRMGMGVIEVESPGIEPGVVVTPQIRAAEGAFRSPGFSPAAFRTPGLSPARFALQGLGRGINRTVAIGLGQIQGRGPIPQVWGDADRALLSYDEQRGAVEPPPSGMPFPGGRLPGARGTVMRARRAGQAADTIAISGLGDADAAEETAMTYGQIDQNYFITAATVSTVSGLASLYHGYRRNSGRGPGPALGWGLWWGLMGAVFPLVTPVVGVAQGWAKPRKGR